MNPNKFHKSCNRNMDQDTKIITDTLEKLLKDKSLSLLRVLKEHISMMSEMTTSKSEMMKQIQDQGYMDKSHTPMDIDIATERLEYLSDRGIKFFNLQEIVTSDHKFMELSEEFKQLIDEMYQTIVDDTYIELMMILNALLASDPHYFRKDKN
jgi:hypothetical protein